MNTRLQLLAIEAIGLACLMLRESQHVGGVSKVVAMVQEGWVTIGSHSPKENEEKKGGVHVFIDGHGNITKGPAHMVGKKPSELKNLKSDSQAGVKNDPGNKSSDGRGGGATKKPPAKTSGQVASTPSGPAPASGDKSGASTDKPAHPQTTTRVPASKHEVNERLNHYEQHFRETGQHPLADLLGAMREHVNAVGTDEALKSLGEEIEGKGESVQYAGSNLEGNGNADFIEAYLEDNGITLMHGSKFDPKKKAISTVSPSSDEEGTKARGQARDVFPQLQTLRDKLHEAQHLPGLEKSEDMGVLMGGNMGEGVPSFSPDVIGKLDEKYGKGQWIVKAYGDEAYAGFGIYFPQRAAQIQKEAQSTIWDAGSHVAKHGFEIERDKSGKAVGLKYQGGDSYPFGSEKYKSTIHGDVRHWGDLAHESADDEQGASMPRGEDGKLVKMMAQPAFPVVGISNEERASGVTFKRGGEGRVHIVTRNGKAEIVPHSTWLKEEPLPVVFEDEDTKAMAQAAVDAINALPESERKGQLYAPDIVKTANGYKVVEANPANEAGASGYLQDNPFIIDSYVSHLTGREPAHVKFIRKLLSAKNAPS